MPMSSPDRTVCNLCNFSFFPEGSNEAEQELAMGMAAVVSPDRSAETISEGGEPDEFWDSVGGKGEYSKEVHLDRPVLPDGYGRILRSYVFGPSGF